MTINRLPFSFVAVFALCFITFAGAEPTPQTPRKPVTDEYQGVKVDDPYQWLEDDQIPDVKAWSDAQNQHTRAYLDQLPDRVGIEKQLTELYAKTSPSYSG